MLFEQSVLSFGGQIHQQAFGQPCGRLAGVETGFEQRGRPVQSKVDGHSVTLRRWQGAVFGHPRGLVLEHLGLVDLVDGRLSRPLQAIGTRVQSGSQDDDLADTCRSRIGEEGVEEVGSHGLVIAHVREDRGHFGVGLGDLGGELLASDEVPHTTTDAGDQHLGIWIADQRVGLGGLSGAGRGDHHGRRADARRDIPGVVMRAQRAHRAMVPKNLAELYELWGT